MGQHILRNAGAAAKENGLGHTFQYLGENDEVTAPTTAGNSFAPRQNLNFHTKKTRTGSPIPAAAAKALHKMVCKEIIVLITYTLSENHKNYIFR